MYPTSFGSNNDNHNYNYYNNNNNNDPNWMNLISSYENELEPISSGHKPGGSENSFVFDEISAVLGSKEFQSTQYQPISANNTFTTKANHNNNYLPLNDTYQPVGLISGKASQQQDNNNLSLSIPNVLATNQCNNRIYHIETPENSGSISIMDDSNQNNYQSKKNQYTDYVDSFAHTTQATGDHDELSSRQFVEIVEQPAKCALRFRYKCEGRSAGSLPGTNSTSENKTFPTIKIHNHNGRAVVVVSCVTRDEPYRAHPHNIVGREGCKKGICTIVIPNNDSTTVRSFSSLGIQCVKRKDIEDSLALRESINVDPFRQGFEHKLNASDIDLNSVRLCFQVFIEGSIPGKCDIPLMPVVSDPIYDKKAMSDLVITKLSHCSAPATGGREVILLCDRIAKDDITIRFYEERDGKLVWETYYEPSCTDIHKQVAISFRTPKYYNENIQQAVMARIQLKRISDGQMSEPRLFQFLPCESDEDIILRKRQKIDWVNSNRFALNNILQSPMQHNPQSQDQQHFQQQATHAVLHQNPIAQMYINPNQQNQIDLRLPERNLEPSTSNQPTLSPREGQPNQPIQNQQQSSKQMIDTRNLFVRQEIIDNDGRVVRLVDMQRINDDQGNNQAPLASSLEKIVTAELVRDYF